ncbi:efflux RND transporter periplasmic adaptor subunit [Rhodomicrobium lacus]|uniref:efflux RND transporter periplasmic adaptor subunit n=1 Tax=Rhodomicrobium lacus TaxID=2498452 RepID=UPI0026E1FF96|nr:efflux RND transporter periplasmic adaptor subunit [Rhodomicrobium lacus]WKW50951.1 efflux RND transporter periplasmic adaptor subunit [Rhodomicrobium lacus]
MARAKALAGAAALAAFASFVALHRYEAGADQGFSLLAAKAAGRAALYYKDPDGKNDFSPEPKKTKDGRAYLPVYEEDEPTFKAAEPKKPKGTGKILYYRNPMGLPDVSQTPKKDSMGMDYIPVYEGDADDDGAVTVAPGRLQRTGVQTEAATRRVIATEIRAPGTIAADEHRQTVVALRFDAFLDDLAHITTGAKVKKGEPLMHVYSATLSAAAAQYVTDLGIKDTALPAGRGARQRLENLGVPDEIVRQIEKSRQGSLTVTWPAPRDGYVIEHNVVEGQQAKAGDVLFRIADLSVVWVLADVAERDIGLVAAGQPVTVMPRGLPGKAYGGTIAMVYPVLNKETRTLRVRIELQNPDTLLKPNMYADVVIGAGAGKPVIAVPENAVIDSGARRVVLVEKGEGRFEPREVETGQRGIGLVEVKKGLRDGEKVVTSANFLIDAESNLKAALKGLAAANAGGEQ